MCYQYLKKQVEKARAETAYGASVVPTSSPTLRGYASDVVHGQIPPIGVIASAALPAPVPGVRPPTQTQVNGESAVCYAANTVSSCVSTVNSGQ